MPNRANCPLPPPSTSLFYFGFTGGELARTPPEDRWDTSANILSSVVSKLPQEETHVYIQESQSPEVDKKKTITTTISSADLAKQNIWLQGRRGYLHKHFRLSRRRYDIETERREMSKAPLHPLKAGRHSSDSASSLASAITPNYRGAPPPAPPTNEQDKKNCGPIPRTRFDFTSSACTT